jgi:hypothetical protein
MPKHCHLNVVHDLIIMPVSPGQAGAGPGPLPLRKDCGKVENVLSCPRIICPRDHLRDMLNIDIAPLILQIFSDEAAVTMVWLFFAA